jgi:hypothetical protein
MKTYGIITLNVVVLHYAQFIRIRAFILVVLVGLGNVQYYHVEMLCSYAMCYFLELGHLI